MGKTFKAPVTEEQRKASAENAQNEAALNQIRSDIRAETNARQNEDASINQNLAATRDILSEEIGTRTAEIAEIKGDLNSETVARTNADTALGARIDKENSDRNSSEGTLRNEFNNAVDAEKQARQKADIDLNAALTATIDSETALRETADSKIIERLNAEANVRVAEDTNLSRAISDEAQTRASEDTKLQDALETERKTRADAIAELKTSLMNALDEADNRRVGVDSSLDTAITAEATARTKADAAINDAIEAERKARADADTALKNDLTAAINTFNNNRVAAETELDDAISDEARTRSDEDSKLRGAVTAEATARSDAINKLQGDIQTAIDNEKAAREAADNTLSSNWANAIKALAPIESPTFAGVPKVPALSDGADVLQAANKGYVDDKLKSVNESLSVFTSPTANTPGKQGQVPAPEKGTSLKLLTNFGWRAPNDTSLTFGTLPSQSGSLTYNGNTQTPSWARNCWNKSIQI